MTSSVPRGEIHFTLVSSAAPDADWTSNIPSADRPTPTPAVRLSRSRRVKTFLVELLDEDFLVHHVPPSSLVVYASQLAHRFPIRKNTT
jgi:hypothetical protein